MKDVENHRNRFNGIHIVDSLQRNPKGLPESSRWSQCEDSTEKVISRDRTPKRVPDVRTT